LAQSPTEEQSSGAGAVSLRTRAFVDALALGLIVVGLALRVRLHAGSPLPSEDAVSWFLLGAAEDVAVVGLAGAAALLLCRAGASERAARALLGLFGGILVVLLAAWGEAVMYFGHAPRSQDLRVASRGSFALYSLDAALGFRFALLAVLLVAVFRAAFRWSRRARVAWSTPARLGLAGAAAAALAALPLTIHQRESARNAAAVAVALVREESPGGASRGVPASGAPDARVRVLVRAAGPPSFPSAEFPLAQVPAPRSDAAPTLPAGMRPNIVFIVMEGLRAEEVGAYGGTIPDLTPNLDRLAREGVRIDRAYSPGTHTPEGELALWYGLLALPEELLLRDAPDTALTGLPEILRAAGWRSFLWIHDSDQTFFGEDRFFLPRGFRTIDGRDFDPRDTRTSWGYSDRALARRAVDAIDRLERPFGAMVLTISNHHPFQVPADAQSTIAIEQPEERGFLRLPGLAGLVGRHTVPMLRTVHYTDEAIGDFFERARARPWFAGTIFVVTSDHGLPIAPLTGELTAHRLEELRHRVPLIFYAPSLLAAGQRAGPASLVDAMPTLLGLLGLQGPRPGVGCDLLDPSGCDPSRAVVMWNDEARMVSLASDRFVYHAVPGDRAGGGSRDERLFEPRNDPRGTRDVSASEGASLAALREVASVYLDRYPAVVAGGRSGLPSPPPGSP